MTPAPVNMIEIGHIVPEAGSYSSEINLLYKFLRIVLNASLNSVVKTSGCSHAAKCPPFGA